MWVAVCTKEGEVGEGAAQLSNNSQICFVPTLSSSLLQIGTKIETLDTFEQKRILLCPFYFKTQKCLNYVWNKLNWTFKSQKQKFKILKTIFEFTIYKTQIEICLILFSTFSFLKKSSTKYSAHANDKCCTGQDKVYCIYL